jgi:carbon-monoxide dehydrogenase iron sulfur subunit
MKRIYIREEYCINCRLCEVHCIVQNSKTKNIIKAYKGEYPKPLPRVVVEEKGYLSFALQCRHCEDAPCLEACMTGAVHRDPATRAILCDEDRCVGCWMCIMVCPTGSIRQNTNHVGTTGRIASKCDLCYGAGIPACVAHCPNEALTYEETGAEAAPLAAGRGPSAGGAETIGRKAE